MSALTQFGGGQVGKANTGHAFDPADLLTPAQLAERLQVSASWIFEQTRKRARVRNGNPLPCIRLGKYIRFSWVKVCEWMIETNR
jgi:hypothetical protein